MLAAAGVTPNQVTILAFLISCGVGATLCLSPDTPRLWLLLPVWMFLRMALNAIDGMLAREHNLQTPLGGLLNELTDPLADAALILPFALLDGVWAMAIIGVVVLAQATELVGVVAIEIGASRRYDGPMGKSDRAAVFGVAALLVGCGVTPGTWLNVVIVGVLLATLATVLNRGRCALREVAG